MAWITVDYHRALFPFDDREASWSITIDDDGAVTFEIDVRRRNADYRWETVRDCRTGRLSSDDFLRLVDQTEVLIPREDTLMICGAEDQEQDFISIGTGDVVRKIYLDGGRQLASSGHEPVAQILQWCD